MTDEITRAWLAHYGAPILGASVVAGRVAPDLESVLVDGLELSRRDPSLARAFPVLLWLRRSEIDTARLRQLASKRRQQRTLGFFMDVAAQLSGDSRLRDEAARIRPSMSGQLINFFTTFQSPVARARAEENTPRVARAWRYRMNIGMDAFETLFAKVGPFIAKGFTLRGSTPST